MKAWKECLMSFHHSRQRLPSTRKFFSSALYASHKKFLSSISSLCWLLLFISRRFTAFNPFFSRLLHIAPRTFAAMPLCRLHNYARLLTEKNCNFCCRCVWWWRASSNARTRETSEMEKGEKINTALPLKLPSSSSPTTGKSSAALINVSLQTLTHVRVQH